jgi:hypothetical protein
VTGAVSRPPLTFRRAPPVRRPGSGSNKAAAPATAATDPGRTAPSAERRSLGERATVALHNTAAQQAATGGLFILAGLFLFSLLFPHQFYIFGLMFQPYRFWLTILFIPLLVMFFQGKAGKPMIVDWLMIGSTLWVLLSMLKNHGVGLTAVTGSSYTVEFLGAYLLARIAIRSSADFRRMVKVLFVVILILLPFAALEAIFWIDPPIPRWIGAEWIISNKGERLGMRRAQAVFEHPILFGAFVSTAFGLVWYALIPNASFVARMFLVSFVGFSTLFSLSTGAFLAVIVQMGLIGWELMTRPHPQRWKIFAWIVVIGYLVLDQLTTRSPFHTLVRYAAFNSQSSYNRILIFEHGMAVVKANPIFGIGFRDWPRPRWMNPSVDNFWLLIAMRHGVPALLMFAAAIALIVLRAGRQPLIDPVDRACRAGYLTALGGIIIAGGTVHYWRALLVFVIFIIGSGVWMITGGARSPAEAGGSEKEDDPPADGKRSARGRQGGGGLRQPVATAEAVASAGYPGRALPLSRRT